MTMTLHHQLLHAITEYDRRQSTKPGYNMWALPQYIRRLDEVEKDIARGASVRDALIAGFCGRLLDVCLKAAAVATSTKNDHMGRYVYIPVTLERK